MTINGGEIASIEATGAGIYHPQDGTLTVTGGTITGATGIYFKGGDLAISGGTVKGTGAEADYVYSGNGFNATGDALVIENVAKDGYEAIGTVSITGGTFISEDAAPIASYGDSKKVEFLGEDCGAQFNKVFDESLLVVGYQLDKRTDDTYFKVYKTNRRESYTIIDGAYEKFVNKEELTIGTLTYERTLESTKWLALYVPFEIPVATLIELGYEVAYLNDVRSYDNWIGSKNDNKPGQDGVIDDMVVESVILKAGKLKANHPYIIRAKSEAAKEMRLVLNEVKLRKTSEQTTVECSSAYTKYIIGGTYVTAGRNVLTGDATGNTPCYGIQTATGNWAKLSEKARLTPFRLFFYMTQKDGSPVVVEEDATESIRMRVIGESEDETTDIEYYDYVDESVDYIYDLHGRRVMEPQKGGIYIINGEKVVF